MSRSYYELCCSIEHELCRSGCFGAAFGKEVNCGLFTRDFVLLDSRRRDLKIPELQKLLKKKWDEVAMDLDGVPIMKDGKAMTYGELVVDRLFTDRKLTNELLNRMFGKGEVIEKQVEVRVLKPNKKDFTSIESRLMELDEKDEAGTTAAVTASSNVVELK